MAFMIHLNRHVIHVAVHVINLGVLGQIAGLDGNGPITHLCFRELP
jgi:hypothetical protein